MSTLSNPLPERYMRTFQPSTLLSIKSFKVIIALMPLVFLFVSKEELGLQVLSILQYRVLLVFAFATLSWVLEPIPPYATSVAVIVLLLITGSDQGMSVFTQSMDSSELLSSKEVFSTFASPIILLFLGGFFMAIAASKYELDKTLASWLMKPFGKSPSMVMLGLMLVTAVFSMFMSNTATTAMMLAIVFPIVNAIDQKDPLRKGLLLCIPLAANIGGIGTPIGTPPNAIAMKYLADISDITFAQWMMLGVPYVILMLGIAWVMLRVLFKTQITSIELSLPESIQLSPKAVLVLVTFVATVLLWITKSLHGMNAYVVAMIPIALFLILGVINTKDLKEISWDVLWLVSGGIALGLALDQSGLAYFSMTQVSLESVHVLYVLIGLSFLGMVMANFMSNTAAANLLLPLIVVLASRISTIDEIGGALVLVLSVTISVSLGMSLPISTPPNALAFASGKFQTKDMARVGVIMGLLGVLMILFFMFIYHKLI